MSPRCERQEVWDNQEMNPQPARPVVLVEGLPQSRRLLLGGRDDHESEPARGSERRELTKPATLINVRCALAGDVGGGAAEIDADQLQHAVRIATMGGGGQRDRQPRAALPNFTTCESGPRRLTARGIDQHGVVERQGLRAEWERSLSVQSERLRSGLPQHVVRRGM
jgi:hypothetical protein